MISTWTVYWVSRLDALHAWFDGVMAVSFIIAVICGIFILVGRAVNDMPPEITRGLLRLGVPPACVGILAGVIITVVPTTREAVAIYAIPRIVNSLPDGKAAAREVYEISSALKDGVLSRKDKDAANTTLNATVRRYAEGLADVYDIPWGAPVPAVETNKEDFYR